ncbi:hypothetical protein ACN47E_007666 [Coniothyrium glycines]
MTIDLSTPNTSPTPTRPGHWVVTKFGDPSVLAWEPFDPLSSLSTNNVLVRILVAGIAGVDNIARAGGLPRPRSQTPGFTPGQDFVGEVLALGEAVPVESGLAVGDRVTALTMFDGHATHIVVPYDELLRIEKDDDPMKMAALPANYMMGWGMLKHIGYELRPGCTVLVGSAGGGLGTALAQLVHAFDMGIKMIGTTSPSKLDYVRSLGIMPVDRNAPDVVEQVLALTNGEGVDIAYDAVCSEESVKQGLAVIKKDVGRVIVVGVMDAIAKDGSRMLGSVEEIFEKRLQPPLVDFFLLHMDFAKTHERAEFYSIVDKVRDGKLCPIVAQTFRLSQAVEAHNLLIEGSAVKGRPMFIVEETLAKQIGI